jgi:hypothetical protein
LDIAHTITTTPACAVIDHVEFMAPEMYDEQYDEKVDIYS